MQRVFVSGAAGLVGQNLIVGLRESGRYAITAADKHPTNTALLRTMHPDVEVIEADLSAPGPWEDAAAACDVAVSLHAQIGGTDESAFERNNAVATERLMAALERGRCAYLVHASSSAVKSKASDFYTESKKKQERLVSLCPVPHAVLRPTLMFGWFDRKHLGWLKAFMSKAPVFPIPGNGRYLRQPLYAGDFSAVVTECLDRRIAGVYDITGLECIDYIDLIAALRSAANLRTPIVKIPYVVFWMMLRIYEMIDRDPPFTTSQLKALATPDVFDTVDWPGIFGVAPTPLEAGLERTFRHPVYSGVSLAF